MGCRSHPAAPLAGQDPVAKRRALPGEVRPRLGRGVQPPTRGAHSRRRARQPPGEAWRYRRRVAVCYAWMYSALCCACTAALEGTPCAKHCRVAACAAVRCGCAASGLAMTMHLALHCASACCACDVAPGNLARYIAMHHCLRCCARQDSYVLPLLRFTFRSSVLNLDDCALPARWKLGLALSRCCPCRNRALLLMAVALLLHSTCASAPSFSLIRSVDGPGRTAFPSFTRPC